MCEICLAVALTTRAGPTNRPKPAPRPGPVIHGHCGRVLRVLAFSMPAMGGLRHAKPSNGVSSACQISNDAIPPVWWRRSRELRGCGRQSADPLGEESPKTTGFAEWVCDLAESIAVAVCWSHVTPEHAPHSLVVHSPACRGINRLTSCESCYTTVLSSNEAKSGRG